MATPRPQAQEFPSDWNVAFSDTTTNHGDEKAATESIRAPSDNASTEKPPLSRVETSFTLSDEEPLEIIGSTNIYDVDGKIRLIPVSTRQVTT